jgi:Putative MetA-pathway of phenol degradation
MLSRQTISAESNIVGRIDLGRRRARERTPVRIRVKALPLCLLVLTLGCVARAGEPPPAVSADVAGLCGNAGDSKECPSEEERRFGICETLWQSICGKPDPCRPWHPLLCATLFTEGWLEPWISPPDGASGAVRQGWINDFEAFFNRNIFGIYTFTDATPGHPDANNGTLTFETPLSRRYMFGIIVPFVNTLDARDGLQSAAGFGDITIENRVIVEETRSFTLSANLDVQTPTGEHSVGYDRTILNPFLAVWTDVGGGFSVRGGAGLLVPVDDEARDKNPTAQVNLCLGQTLSKHDATPLGDFTYFVCANLFEGLGNNDHTLVTLTPGFRAHLGHDWFLLLGAQVPVTGSSGYREQPTLVLVKGW